CGAVSYFWASFGLTPDAPKPLRKPLCRRYPTDGPGKRSSIAIFAVLPAKSFFAYLPIRTPAVKLLVANSASTAVGGFGGVSSAITSTPFARAFLIAGTTESLLGVIRIAFTPALIRFSVAV